MISGGRDDDFTPEPSAQDAAQIERARGSWELVVQLDAREAEAVERLRRALRFTRADREALRAMLPGAVRRGARVDLLPMLEKLRSLGIPAEIRRREDV